MALSEILNSYTAFSATLSSTCLIISIPYFQSVIDVMLNLLLHVYTRAFLNSRGEMLSSMKYITSMLRIL